MPIYAYRCESCGFAKDVLQKMSDPVLTECPSCQQASFRKQLTAAGFQLKGTGWYVTDFRDGQKKPGAAAPSADAAQKPATETGAKTESGAAQSDTPAVSGTASSDASAV